jgi:hypothetical protein
MIGGTQGAAVGHATAAPSFAETEIETAALRRHRQRRSQRFLKGPIPMPDIASAARLPGAALALLLAIHHRTALTGNAVVTLPQALLNELGIAKDAKARGLHHLEDAGLIGVERRPGRAARVWLRSVGDR